MLLPVPSIAPEYVCVTFALLSFALPSISWYVFSSQPVIWNVHLVSVVIGDSPA